VFATSPVFHFPPAMSRVTLATLTFIQNALVIMGMIFAVALFGLYSGHASVVDGMKAILAQYVEPAEPEVSEPLAEAPDASDATLNPRMRGALDYVSRRYRVSTDALQPIFATAQSVGAELRIDPLLIIAVIGIESGFNPLSQSVAGAQGLMQVMPQFHRDKLPEDAGQLPFFDPVTNVQVGARILKESIRRNGGVHEGLQQFAGAIGDPERRYASKVMAERQRLEQAAAQRPRPA